MASEFEKFWLGDTETEDQLKKDIADTKVLIAKETDPAILNSLRTKLSGLQGKLTDMLTKAGVLNPDGTPVKAMDAQNKYIDKSYLEGLANQSTRARDTALSAALQQAGKMNQKGFSTGIADLSAGLEQSMLNADSALNQAVKQEKELAYSKATNQLISDYNMITGLSDRERSSIQQDIANAISKATDGKIKLAELNSELNNLPEGALVGLAKNLASIGVGALTTWLSGGNTTAGGAVKTLMDQLLKPSTKENMQTGYNDVTFSTPQANYNDKYAPASARGNLLRY